MIREVAGVTALASAAAILSFAASRSFDATVTRPHSAAGVTLESVAGAPARLYDSRHPTLVVFGYIGCADRCPLTLRTLAVALAHGASGPTPRIAFVDIDPQRDTRHVLGRYAASFPGVVALSGRNEDVDAAQRSLGVVPVSRSDLERHDTRVFVLDERGTLVGTLPPVNDPSEAQARLRVLLASRIDSGI